MEGQTLQRLGGGYIRFGATDRDKQRTYPDDTPTKWLYLTVHAAI